MLINCNDVIITELIRDKGNTIVWILRQKHMATLMRAPPASFLQNLTQIWSQMIDAHHIFNSSIVVYLHVVSPWFCLHNRAFKEQEVARQKLLSGGGKRMKWCRERRSEVNLWNLWRNHLGGLNCKWENIERWWFKALSKHFYNTEQSPKETWKQSWLEIYCVIFRGRVYTNVKHRADRFGKTYLVIRSTVSASL